MQLSFDADEVRRLLTHSETAAPRRPSPDQVFSPEFWRKDMCQDRRLSLMAEVVVSGFALSATPLDVDRSLIEPGLWLVGYQGIFLMSNGATENPVEDGLISYAIQADPTTLSPDIWEPVKNASFGPENGVEILPREAVQRGLGGTGRFLLDVTPQKITIMLPQAEPRLSPVF